MSNALDDASLDELRRHLADDAEAGLQAFRTKFLDALDQYRFEECEKLLALLAATPHLFLRQAGRHYQASLRFEQHRFDEAEALLRTLLTEELQPLQRARSLLGLALALIEQGLW